MKIDPNSHCITYKQNLFWAIIHDVVAHPLMALTFYKIKMFIKLHDYTSHLAWERNTTPNKFTKGLGTQTSITPTGTIYFMNTKK
jgi:hypothetical protein